MSWKNPLGALRSRNNFEKSMKSIVGFYPSNAFFYEQAFIHKSLANNDPKIQSNERLEFLGDAILSAIITEHLFSNFPKMDEGDLSRMRAKVVSRNSLNEVAKKMDLQQFIKANIPAELMSSSLLGNALEALIGAIYLDQGYSKTEDFILKKFLKFIDIKELSKLESNFKSRALEWGQKHRKEITFKVINELGQGHQKTFTIAVLVDGTHETEASASSKKKAEQKAAQLFCAKNGL